MPKIENKWLEESHDFSPVITSEPRINVAPKKTWSGKSEISLMFELPSCIFFNLCRLIIYFKTQLAPK